MKILHLTLKKKWFDLIATGEKKQEYRENKPYWQSRLHGKTFNEIHFRNGYAKDAPFMRVKCGDIHLQTEISPIHSGSVFVIELGDILEVKNAIQ